ncbi:MAG: response regulator [Geobacteraceae bacterium]|nr:MAG: response regulator [Geobacteraceae bacterium]
MMIVRLLLAEDNEPLSQMLQKFLAAKGFDVLAAKTGTDAMQILASTDIDLLLLDLRLPGMSGIEILQKLRQSPKWAALPVIIMTGVYKGDKFASAVRRLGVKHYLEKPFTQQALLQAVQSILEEVAARKGPPPLLQQITDIYNNRKSGLLHLAKGPPVSFFKGEPFSFHSRGREEFPSFLVARSKIRAVDKNLIVEYGEDRLFITQAGLLGYHELMEESRLFLAKLLMDALALNAGGEFIEGADDAEVPLIPLSLPSLLYEAAGINATESRTHEFIARYGAHYPARTGLFFRRANLTAMRTEDIELMGRINGERSVNEIIAPCASEKGAAAFVHFLFSLDMIALHGEPAAEAVPDFPQKCLFNRPLEEPAVGEDMSPGFEDLVADVSLNVEMAVGDKSLGAPLSNDEIDFEQTVQRDFAFVKDKNYYELFGLTQGAFNFNALKEAYFTKSRQYSPEKFMELSGSAQETAQEVLSVYAHAYNTLSNVVAKERYDEMLHSDTVGLDGKQDEKLQTKIQFQSGNVFLEMGEFENAEKAFQDAYTLEPENALHCAYLAWAICKNPAHRDSKAAQDKARTLLGKSLMIEKTAEAFAFRGWMLLDEGRDALAEGEFQKALRINPKEMSARKGLDQIQEKRESNRKGLFRKIFG